MRHFTVLFVLILPVLLFCQEKVGINNNNPTSTLDIKGVKSNGADTATLKLFNLGTNPITDPDRLLLIDGNDIDGLIGPLYINRLVSNGVSIANGGGNVGVNSDPFSNTKLAVVGPPIDILDEPKVSPATFTLLNAGEELNQMIMDGNNVITIDNSLHLNQSSSHDVVLVAGGGNVGVNNNNPTSKFSVTGMPINGGSATMEVRSSANIILIDGEEIDSNGPLYINRTKNQQVIIGDNVPASGYKLSVAGNIMAEEVRVQLVAMWPDYVFDSNYNLLSLEELDSYINENHHLPGIPSADEIQSSGLQLGEMQTKMMEKIEELTLHLIRLDKRVSLLEKENESLRKKLGK